VDKNTLQVIEIGKIYNKQVQLCTRNAVRETSPPVSLVDFCLEIENVIVDSIKYGKVKLGYIIVRSKAISLKLSLI